MTTEGEAPAEKPDEDIPDGIRITDGDDPGTGDGLPVTDGDDEADAALDAALGGNGGETPIHAGTAQQKAFDPAPKTVPGGGAQSPPPQAVPLPTPSKPAPSPAKPGVRTFTLELPEPEVAKGMTLDQLLERRNAVKHFMADAKPYNDAINAEIARQNKQLDQDLNSVKEQMEQKHAELEQLKARQARLQAEKKKINP